MSVLPFTKSAENVSKSDNSDDLDNSVSTLSSTLETVKPADDYSDSTLDGYIDDTLSNQELGHGQYEQLQQNSTPISTSEFSASSPYSSTPTSTGSLRSSLRTKR
jgi:hypothetical protein